jgi:hypothetical protein
MGNTRKFQVQVCLRHEKGDRSIKKQIHRRLKPKGEDIKTGRSDVINQRVQFFLCRSNPIRDIDPICFEKIFPISI